MRLRAGSVVVSLLVVLSITSAVSAEPAPRHSTSQIDWLAVVNYYRAQAGLAPVAEDHAMSDGAYNHSIYGVKTGVFEHSEDESNPWYTPEGEKAAHSSILWGWPDHDVSERAMISRFMGTPIHGQVLWDVDLGDIGYGRYSEDGEYTGAATTIGADFALRRRAPDDHFPVVWPGPGTVVPFIYGIDESPSYREMCGFAQGKPWGLPIGFHMKRSLMDEPTDFTHTVTSNGAQLPHCAYRIGHLVWLIPNEPLVPGQSYQASVTLEGTTASTNFSVTKMPLVACPLTAPAGQEVELTFANFRDNSYAPGQDSPADHGWVDIIFDGDMYVMGDRVEVGESPGQYDVIGSYTFPNPGTYNFKVLVADPYAARHEVNGSVTVTQGGTVGKGECSAPPLPPEPPKPPMRPRPPHDDYEPFPFPEDPEPDPSGEPTPIETEEPYADYHGRELTLRSKGHLRLRGRIVMQRPEPACMVGQTIVIDRRKRDDSWVSVTTTTTNSEGRYRATVPDKRGYFRAEVESHQPTDLLECGYAYVHLLHKH